MLTPKLSEVIFFFLVLSATPGPAEPRGPRGSLAPPIIGPDEGKILFLKCYFMYCFHIKKWNSPSVTQRFFYCPHFFAI